MPLFSVAGVSSTRVLPKPVGRNSQTRRKRDTSKKRARGWGRGGLSPSLLPYFFSRSLTSGRTPLTKRLEQATR